MYTNTHWPTIASPPLESHTNTDEYTNTHKYTLAHNCITTTRIPHKYKYRYKDKNNFRLLQK